MVPDFSSPQHLHVIAVGGAAMSAVAHIAAAMGHRVTGSDQSDSENLRRLAGEGIEVWTPHDPSKFASIGRPTVVAISAAVKAANTELLAAEALGVPIASRADVMEAFGLLRRTVAVSGTAGKTTTSAMMATIAVAAGWDPSMIVGSTVPGLGNGMAWRDTPWFIVEADESDGSFLRFHAEAVIVNSIEADHLDYWGTLTNLEAGFDAFVTQASGPKLLCADDAGCNALRRRIGGVEGLSTFGFAADADYRIEDFVATGLKSSFVVHYGREQPRVQAVSLQVPGRHNALNATAAFAMAEQLGIAADVACDALASFRGAARRFEFRGEARGVTFVDDYAHLPAKALAAVSGALLGGWSRLIAVYQPHRYTRTRDLWADYSDCFVGVDLLVITGIYAAGQEPIEGVSGQLIVDAVRTAHPEQRVVYCETRAELIALLSSELADGDLCLTMNAGDLTTLPDEMLSSPWAHTAPMTGG